MDLGAARIISGRHNGTRVMAPIRDIKLQHFDGKAWQNLLPAVTGNERAAWAATFTAVKIRQIRLVITATPLETSAIWEVDYYAPLKTAKD